MSTKDNRRMKYEYWRLQSYGFNSGSWFLAGGLSPSGMLLTLAIVLWAKFRLDFTFIWVGH
jgi:hypothetical protein